MTPTVLGNDGAVCGGCGAALRMLSTAYSDDRWLFCSLACGALWPGHPPMAWVR